MQRRLVGTPTPQGMLDHLPLPETARAACHGTTTLLPSHQG